jgi:hypothetical protein
MHVRQWWFVTDSGSVALTIKYGSKVLEIAKGKNAIEVTDGTCQCENCSDSYFLFKHLFLLGFDVNH